MVTKDNNNVIETATPVVSPYALFFELEGPLTGGRPLIFDTLQRLMKKEKMELTAPAFTRHGLNLPPARCVQGLIEALDGEGVSADKMTDALFSGLRSAAGNMKPANALVKLMGAARKQGMPVMALSCLPDDVAEVLAEKSGLTNLAVQLRTFHDAHALFPSRDVWLGVCRGLTRSPRRCFALVSTAIACQTALAADVRVVALPDEFTACHDFSGAEWFCETPADLPVDELIGRMGPV